MDPPRELVPGHKWKIFGKHLEYLTLHKKNHQCRLICMWENADTRDRPKGPEVIFEEFEISEELYKKFKEMATNEKMTKEQKS